MEFVGVGGGDVRNNDVEHGGVKVGLGNYVDAGLLGAGVWVAGGWWEGAVEAWDVLLFEDGGMG